MRRIRLVSRPRPGAPSASLFRGEASCLSSPQTSPVGESSPAAVLAAARKRCGLSTTATSPSQTLSSSLIPSGASIEDRLTALGAICEGYGSRPPTPPEGYNRPPLVTYTTTPTEHGDVVRATSDYVRWYLQQYPKAGGKDSARVIAHRSSPQGDGGAFGAGGVPLDL